MSNGELILRLLLQLFVIVAACRVVGALGQRIGQAQVVGEMVTGVLLGPSLFGWLAPAAQAALFPTRVTLGEGVAAVTIAHPSMTILYAVAQLGLALYMFTVGMEFELGLLAHRKASATLVSIAGIGLPLALGAAAAPLLRGEAALFAPAVSDGAAALYLGAAMSITAFPMLARILYEKRIAKTSMGTLALAAGATDDGLAWCLLAVVIASIKGSWSIAALAVVGGGAYAVGMLTVGRRALAAFEARVRRDGALTAQTMALALLVLVGGALLTDAVGIYAVFGAFVAGAAMPRGRFSEAMTEKLEPFVSTFLLPVFFVYSGLNTRVGLLASGHLWVVALILTLLAIGGKGVGCLLAARFAGEPWREATAIGALMNARGLMELIILNIGLEQGVITPTLFTMMVLMAILTTLMASPLFEWLYGDRAAGLRAAA